jgi:SAM-dependent methyltransferase
MSYKVLLWDNLTPIEWSQASWRRAAERVPLEECEQEWVRDVLLRHLPRGGLIVDAGCGSGKWPIYLRRRGYRVVGIEISRDGCALARAGEPGLDLLQCDARQAAVKGGSVDAIVSLGVIEHDEAGPGAALAEAHRMLRPGGLLIVAVPFDNPWRRCLHNRLLDRATRRRRAAGQRLAFTEYRFSARELRRYLVAAGFDPVVAFTNELSPPHNMGLWVDWNNLVADPLRPPASELFLLPGALRRPAAVLQRCVPRLVAGEVGFVARAV